LPLPRFFIGLFLKVLLNTIHTPILLHYY